VSAPGFLRVEGLLAAGGSAPLTFEVSRGRCLGLLGASALGTSRLLQTVAALEKPATGRVTIADIDVRLDPDAARRHVAIMRRSCIDSGLRLHEYLSAVSHARKASGFSARASVSTVIERLALNRARSLSSPAARSEAALAAALLPAVGLVLLDEPFRDLSDETRARAIEWIRALAQETVAVVIAGPTERDLRAVSHTVVSVEASK
jgi:ABC-type multidrug transport system ATPase subunit